MLACLAVAWLLLLLLHTTYMYSKEQNEKQTHRRKALVLSRKLIMNYKQKICELKKLSK
jgi:hypothetical protein